MLRFFNVTVEVPQIVEPRGVIVVLDDRQVAGLREPPQLSRTHAEVQRCFFRAQKSLRDVRFDWHHALRTARNV